MRLYHYCTLSVFESVYLSRKYRLFDITKSNDSKEITYGLDLFKTTMIAAYNATRAKYFRERANKEKFTDLVDGWVDNLVKTNIPVCYAICFSVEQDLLSQWRGYADDGRGLSFGIDKAKLHLWASSEKFVLKKIEYNRNQQRKRMREISDEVIRLIKTNLNKKEVKPIEEIISQSLEKYKSKVLETAVSMKSNFFKEEREWRLFAFDNHLNSKYIKNNTILSKAYIEISLDDIFSHCGIEQHIVLGPKCCVKPEELLTFVGVDASDTKISASKGTYR